MVIFSPILPSIIDQILPYARRGDEQILHIVLYYCNYPHFTDKEGDTEWAHKWQNGD